MLDRDVGLVNAPGAADRTRESIPTLLEFEHITLDPTKDRTRCDTDAALEHHGGEVAVRELAGHVPPHTQDDDLVVEVAAVLRKYSTGTALRVLMPPESAMA
jgi:hypothetical protein